MSYYSIYIYTHTHAAFPKNIHPAMSWVYEGALGCGVSKTLLRVA